MWGVGRQRILVLIRRGDLPATNVSLNPAGRPRFLVSVEDIEEFDLRRKVVTPPQITEPESTGVFLTGWLSKRPRELINDHAVTARMFAGEAGGGSAQRRNKKGPLMRQLRLALLDG